MKELYFRKILKFQRTRIKIIVSAHEAKVTSVIYDLPESFQSCGVWKVITQMLDLAYDHDRERLRWLIDNSQPGSKTEFTLAVSDAAKAKHAFDRIPNNKQQVKPISNKVLIQNIQKMWNVE